MTNQESWYYLNDGQDQKGPLSWDQILEAHQKGLIAGGTLVWAQHLPGWIPIEEVERIVPKVYCQFCGQQISFGAVACPHCGKEVHSSQLIDKQAIAEKMKEAARDATTSLQSLALDPIGKLKASHDALPSNRILAAGIVLGVLFSVLLGISISIWNKNLGNFLDNISYFKVLFAAFVPFIGCTLSLSIIRMISKGKGEFSSDCYISGTALLPFGIAMLVSSLLGQGNLEITLILMVTAFCYTILILFTGLVEIFQLPKGISSLLISFILVASAWIDKVILFSMNQHLT